MSRIGKNPIPVPENVKVNIANGFLSVKGPKGELALNYHPEMTVALKDNTIVVTRPSDSRTHKSLHGLTRSLIQNMVTGVVEGYSKQLEIQGVGYSVELRGKNLLLTLGYSHQILIEPPDGISFEVGRGNIITVSGIDKQIVGAVSAQIRSFRPPEPYKGKGIRYVGEMVHRKAGKTIKK
ncbi:MAG: 50S ribosomal protein L6 [Marinimicrobia bacterium 46_47]|nr:MAG: 50S ribosomal protein L6 [Marinimicrobia bacterium 46_47]KUK91858.1 MAG: 50S ribosomal protein L6 [Marinimicrobia bacterium 46_43]HBY18239.1 50S ribosomal protein L6 [Candidatus Neomarinimicrobiota bacterium]